MVVEIAAPISFYLSTVQLWMLVMASSSIIVLASAALKSGITVVSQTYSPVIRLHSLFDLFPKGHYATKKLLSVNLADPLVT